MYLFRFSLQTSQESRPKSSPRTWENRMLTWFPSACKHDQMLANKRKFPVAVEGEKLWDPPTYELSFEKVSYTYNLFLFKAQYNCLKLKLNIIKLWLQIAEIFPKYFKWILFTFMPWVRQHGLTDFRYVS